MGRRATLIISNIVTFPFGSAPLLLIGGRYDSLRSMISRFQKGEQKQMSAKTKTAKLQKVVVRINPIWCNECCLRIAPYEEKIVVGKNAYHKSCSVKLSVAAAAPAREPQLARNDRKVTLSH